MYSRMSNIFDIYTLQLCAILFVPYPQTGRVPGERSLLAEVEKGICFCFPLLGNPRL